RSIVAAEPVQGAIGAALREDAPAGQDLRRAADARRAGDLRDRAVVAALAEQVRVGLVEHAPREARLGVERARHAHHVARAAPEEPIHLGARADAALAEDGDADLGLDGAAERRVPRRLE